MNSAPYNQFNNTLNSVGRGLIFLRVIFTGTVVKELYILQKFMIFHIQR